MNQAQQAVYNWLSNAHKYDDAFKPPELGADHNGVVGIATTGIVDGLYVGDQLTTINTNNTWPNTYQPAYTGGSISLGWPYATSTGTYQSIKTLAEVLGDKAADFTIVPAGITVGCGKEKHTLADLLLKLDNVPFIELNGEIAVAPAVYNAIVLFTKMGEEYAGMTLVDFLNQILSRK